jgi:hypothetical protein
MSGLDVFRYSGIYSVWLPLCFRKAVFQNRPAVVQGIPERYETDNSEFLNLEF